MDKKLISGDADSDFLPSKPLCKSWLNHFISLYNSCISEMA